MNRILHPITNVAWMKRSGIRFYKLRSSVAWMKRSGIRVYKLRGLDEAKRNPGL